PHWMRQMGRRHGQELGGALDWAAIDVRRDGEHGGPRCNRFRALFHNARVTSCAERSGYPELAQTFTERCGHPDKCEIMGGRYAEKPPEGFGFSDTAFRVFILMASRRIKSDRYFTDDFPPAVYTQAGIDWVNDNNMTTLLLRHFPELTPILQHSSNAFAPWQ